MKDYFLDSSALLKKYLEEPGTEGVKHLIAEARHLFISLITELEVASTFERAKRGGRLSSPEYRQAVRDWEKDLSEARFNKIDIDIKTIHFGKRFIKLHRLHPADSIQLASAVLTSQKLDDDISFVCADQMLFDAARLERLSCIHAAKD